VHHKTLILNKGPISYQYMSHDKILQNSRIGNNFIYSVLPVQSIKKVLILLMANILQEYKFLLPFNSHCKVKKHNSIKQNNYEKDVFLKVSTSFPLPPFIIKAAAPLHSYCTLFKQHTVNCMAFYWTCMWKNILTHIIFKSCRYTAS
jgi:hypothetical protein